MHLGEGSEGEELEPSKDAASGASLHPASELSHTRAESTRPPTELPGNKHVPVLRNANGKLKLQGSNVQCLVSVLWEYLLTYLFHFHLLGCTFLRL